MPYHTMNSDLTISGRVFNLAYADKNGSERRNQARGPSIPDVMIVKHQQLAGADGIVRNRSLLKFDRYVTLSTGVITPVTAQMQVIAPVDSNVTWTDINAAMNDVLNVTNNNPAVNGLDKGQAVFSNKEM